MELKFVRDLGWTGKGRLRRQVETGLDRIYLDGKCIGYRALHDGAPWTMIHRLSDAVRAHIFNTYGADTWITEPSALHSEWPRQGRGRRSKPSRRRQLILPRGYDD